MSQLDVTAFSAGVFRVLDRAGNQLSDTKLLKDCGMLLGIVSLHLTVELLPTDLDVPAWAEELLHEANALRPRGQTDGAQLAISDITTPTAAGTLQWVNLVMQGECRRL